MSITGDHVYSALAQAQAAHEVDPGRPPGHVVNAWISMVEEASDLDRVLSPSDQSTTSFDRFRASAFGVHRDMLRDPIPGHPQSGDPLMGVAAHLSRENNSLATGQLPPVVAGRISQALARTVWIGTHHAAAVLAAAAVGPRNEDLSHFRNIAARVNAIEQLAGSQVFHKAPFDPWVLRHERDVARFDIAAHRSLAIEPNVAVIALVARGHVEALKQASTTITRARAHVLPELLADRITLALGRAIEQWDRLGERFAPLAGRSVTADTQLRSAAHQLTELSRSSGQQTSVQIRESLAIHRTTLNSGPDLARAAAAVLDTVPLTGSARAVAQTIGNWSSDKPAISINDSLRNKHIVLPDKLSPSLGSP